MSALDLATAKAYLNIDSDDYDTELTTFINAAEAAIAQRVGPLSSTSVTKRVAGYGWGLHLPVFPVISLTSVTPVGGSALTIGDLFLEGDIGTVSYSSGAFFGSPAYDVVYTAGRSPVPADLLQLVKEVVADLWKSQRGPKARVGAGAEAPAAPLLSLRAIGLIEMHARVQNTIGA